MYRWISCYLVLSQTDYCLLCLAGKYWQVCDGPSSSLTIGTDDVPLGSYMMDVVIYHYRKRDKFIPIGYASTQYSITGEHNGSLY